MLVRADAAGVGFSIFFVDFSFLDLKLLCSFLNPKASNSSQIRGSKLRLCADVLNSFESIHLNQGGHCVDECGDAGKDLC